MSVQGILRSPLLPAKTGARLAQSMSNLSSWRPVALLVVVWCAVVSLVVARWDFVNDLALDAAGLAVVLAGLAVLLAALCLQTARKAQAEQRLRRTEATLETSHARIRDLSERLLVVQEIERARIARELHDDVSQQLAMLHMELHRAGIPKVSLRVAQIEQSLRELTNGLYPATLRTTGLCEALRLMASEYSRVAPAVAFVIRGDAPSRLPPAVTLCLYRVVQETFHNAVKHSRATRVAVDLQWASAELRLTIADDGVGFVLETAASKGLGLISITDRIETVGGRLTISSTQSYGTRIQITVPTQVVSSVRP